MVGRRAQARHTRGGANRRGGEKPRGRNAVSAGSADPKARRSQDFRAGSGLLRCRRRRGDLWTIPREEVRCESIGQLGPECVGKAGTKVKRAYDCSSHDERVTPGEDPRRSVGHPARAAAHDKTTEDGGKPTSPNFTREHPPQAPTRLPGHRAQPGGRDRKVGKMARRVERTFGSGQRR